MFKSDAITLFLIIVFLYPITKGFIIKFSSYNLKRNIESIARNIVFLSAIFLGMQAVKRLFEEYKKGTFKGIENYFPYRVTQFIAENTIIIYIVSIPICTIVIYEVLVLIIKLINSITIYPALDSIERTLERKGNFSKRIIGAAFEVPRSIIYVIIITFTLNIASIIDLGININENLERSFLYNEICKYVVFPVANSVIAEKLPIIINDSFKIVKKEIDSASSKNVIVYYNGITIDEGVKSNKKIDSFAVTLTKKANNDYKKANMIYNWIGKNIKYDSDKAKMIMDNDFKSKSGAVNAFNTRKGICFDYACLYVAMCRANNIKVRMVTGKGFNGKIWVSHAWNQVYIKEQNRWVDVDTTFYIGGNYFDSDKFKSDHIQEGIAGEW